MGTIVHYRSAGFRAQVVNPKAAGSFRIKLSTRGHPCDYSRILCTKDSESVEIHMNLSVLGAHDGGIYCVDVGVIRGGAIPLEKPKTRLEPLPNADLKSLVEAKKLVVYPMLLAQFVGIVHEIAPRFLRGRRRGFGPRGHIPPTLVTLGGLSGTSTAIIRGFAARGFQLNIAPNYDVRLAMARADHKRSPMYGPDHDSSTF